jgi:glycine/serine hydroxymethyltransferase
MTRCGMGSEQMGELAELMTAVIAKQKPVTNEVTQLRSRFRKVVYC